MDLQDGECAQVLPGNARYCFKCGHESTFFRDGILLPWKREASIEPFEHKGHEPTTTPLLFEAIEAIEDIEETESEDELPF